MNRILALLLLLCIGCEPPPRAGGAPRFEVPAVGGGQWFRGNTHAHTLESDGDSPPEEVAHWYRAHGYAFLVLSDHNVLTDPGRLGHLVDSTFLLIPGTELSTSARRRAVHVNALNLAYTIEPRRRFTRARTIQANVDAVRQAGGVPHINHPNYQWALDHRILAQVRDARLLEIFNGHPRARNEGGGEVAGVEAMWDSLLTRGNRIYGIAVDDAHHFRGEHAPDRSNPGRGWVAVRARRLDAGEILRNLEAGQFYASTGVELADVVVTPGRLEVHIAARADLTYRTEFIGSGGRVLARTGSNPAVFTLSAGAETYLRAKVYDSRGAVAWVQPVFVTRE